VPVKTILLCLTSPSSAVSLLKAATPLARRFDAHLVGLHALEALIVYPAISMHISGEGFAEYNKSQKVQLDEIKDIFERYTLRENLMSKWRPQRPDNKTAAAQIIECASAADLVIMAQENDETGSPYNATLVGSIIRDCGRPVLVIPQGFHADTIGEKILLGWNATREATHAAHYLLSIAAPHASIALLTICKSVKGESPNAKLNDLAETYKRHGLKPEIVHKDTSSSTIAMSILTEADDRGSDLIAAGAFGQAGDYASTARSVTYDLLKIATLPVLYSS